MALSLKKDSAPNDSFYNKRFNKRFNSAEKNNFRNKNQRE